MIARLFVVSCALAAVLLPARGNAQLTLYSVQNGHPSALNQAFDFGNVKAGSAEDATFRIEYAGSATPYYLTYFSMNGVGFAVTQQDWTSLPATIPAAGLNFTVHFAPTQVLAYSANLQINQTDPVSIILLGEGSTAPIIQNLSVYLNGLLLSGGATIAFPGTVLAGSAETLTITLANQTPAGAIPTPLTVPAIAVSGADFSLTDASLTGAIVPAGSAVEFTIAFSPTAAGIRAGTLSIGALNFVLQGSGIAPPPPQLPQPSISVTMPSPASAQQGAISVSLAAATATAATGLVQMTFTPASGTSDDPAIGFPDGSRSASFNVAEGSSTAEFNGNPSLAFASGTIAGTISFTVTLGSNSAQASVTIPTAQIGIDAAVAMRNVACIPEDSYCTSTNVELQINAWDNTRTASQVVFRFFGPGGEIAPGDIPWSTAASAFSSYFGGSQEGGAFSIHAIFPINGDPTQVTSALVLLTNAMGTTETQQINF